MFWFRAKRGNFFGLFTLRKIFFTVEISAREARRFFFDLKTLAKKILGCKLRM